MNSSAIDPNSNFSFSPIDYGIFALMLILSSLIGVYYGFCAKKKQDNTAEYLLGDKEMSLIPIAVSLIVTHISGITMLGIPVEIYAYGSQFWLSFVPATVTALALLYVFYPIFNELKLLSTFLYFEKRFNRTIRLVASAACCFGFIALCPMFIYIPALAYSQVSGVSVHVITSILCLVCVFYTTIGGLRAVVWTDTIQFVLMVGAIFAVIVVALLRLNHPLDIFTISDHGGRLILFDLNPSPLVRSSVWTVTIGLSAYWCYCFGAAQSCIQKLLSLPDARTARKAILIYAVGLIVFNLTAVLLGLVMYANLYECDPFTAGAIRKIDQVVPYFITRIGAKIPGLSGLFIAGLFSGGLSSMSGNLNTISSMIYDDFLKSRLENYSEKAISNILKLIVLVIGLIVFGLVFIFERLTTVYELTLAVSGVAGGATIGLFSCGMLCRRINTKGAICGAAAAVILVLIITTGAQSRSKQETLPMRTDGCDVKVFDGTAINLSQSRTPNVAIKIEDEVFWLFRISIMYYTLIGCATVWIVSYPISLLTQTDNEIVDENLLAPFLRRKNIVIEMDIIGEPVKC